MQLPAGSYRQLHVLNNCSACTTARLMVRYQPLLGPAPAGQPPGAALVSAGWFSLPRGATSAPLLVAAVAPGSELHVHATCGSEAWSGSTAWRLGDGARCSAPLGLQRLDGSSSSLVDDGAGASLFVLSCPGGVCICL